MGHDKAQAGYIASASLITSAVGGWGAGVLADRYGRVRILQLTVLWFAAFTFLSGFTHSYGQLLFTRAMQGFGFGGEWSVGSVLVAETIEARHRGKAAGVVQSSWSLGWAAAALAFWGASVLLPPEFAWRVLFWIGIASGTAGHLHPPQSAGASDLPGHARKAGACANEGGGGRFFGYFPAALAAHHPPGEPAVDRNAGRLLLGHDLAADVSADRAASVGDGQDLATC